MFKKIFLLAALFLVCLPMLGASESKGGEQVAGEDDLFRSFYDEFVVLANNEFVTINTNSRDLLATKEVLNKFNLLQDQISDSFFNGVIDLSKISLVETDTLAKLLAVAAGDQAVLAGASVNEIANILTLADFLLLQDWSLFESTFNRFKGDEAFLKEFLDSYVVKSLVPNISLDINLMINNSVEFRNVQSVVWVDENLFWLIYTNKVAILYQDFNQVRQIENVFQIYPSPDATRYWVLYADFSAKLFDNQHALLHELAASVDDDSEDSEAEGVVGEISDIAWSADSQHALIHYSFYGDHQTDILGRQGRLLREVDGTDFIFWDSNSPTNFWVSDTEHLKKFVLGTINPVINPVEEFELSFEANDLKMFFTQNRFLTFLDRIRSANIYLREGDDLVELTDVAAVFSSGHGQDFIKFSDHRAALFDDLMPRAAILHHHVDKIFWYTYANSYFVQFMNGIVRLYDANTNTSQPFGRQIEKISCFDRGQNCLIKKDDKTVKSFSLENLNQYNLIQQLVALYIMNQFNPSCRPVLLPAKYVPLLDVELARKLVKSNYLVPSDVRWQV